MLWVDVCDCVENLNCLYLNSKKLLVRVQWLQASVLWWVCINAVVALFSYFGFRANVWKVHIFNGNSKIIVNSQGAVFLSSSYNESSRGRNSPREGGVGCEKAVWRLEGGGWLWFWGHKRRVQLCWTCSHLGKATARKVLQPLLTAQKNKPLSKHCAGWLLAFPSEIQSSRAWIFSTKMAPSSITHYKPHDSFHCAILNLTRLR